MDEDTQQDKLTDEDKEDSLIYEKICFNSYKTYESTLRTWLVAYGIGAPILFLSNDSLWQKIAASTSSICIAILFLIGVALQIFVALLNKHSMWYCYRGERDDDFQKKTLYKISFWLADRYWIDILIDVFSVLAFVIATYKVFIILLSITVM